MFIIEKGLEQAHRATEAIYSKDVKSLISLSSEDLEQVFNGAPIINLLLSPGISVLELGMKAKCFSTESKYKLSFNIFPRRNPITFIAFDAPNRSCDKK